MNKLLATLLSTVVLISPMAYAQNDVSTKAVIQASQQDEAAIRQLLQDYAAALKSASPQATAALYTDDGIVMPPAAPTAIGMKAVEDNYRATFHAIGLDLTFKVLEINVMGNDAMVRSTSSGTVTLKAENKHIQDHFRELFMLRKVAGKWKIARYMFNQPH